MRLFRKPIYRIVKSWGFYEVQKKKWYQLFWHEIGSSQRHPDVNVNFSIKEAEELIKKDKERPAHLPRIMKVIK